MPFILALSPAPEIYRVSTIGHAGHFNSTSRHLTPVVTDACRLSASLTDPGGDNITELRGRNVDRLDSFFWKQKNFQWIFPVNCSLWTSTFFTSIASLKYRILESFRSFPMSTAVDARRRPNLWSYLSFGSPRRRSISLPKPNGQSQDGSREKSMFEASGYNHSRSSSSAFKDASMTGGQRSRLLKIGGICFVAFVIFYYFTSGDSAGVRDLVKGAHGAAHPIKGHTQANAYMQQELKPRPALWSKKRSLSMSLGRRSARSPFRKIKQ